MAELACSSQHVDQGLADGLTASSTDQVSWKLNPSGKDADNNLQDFQFGQGWANPQNRQSPLYGDN